MTKEELIEQHRDINVASGFNWQECIEEDLKDDLETIGFSLDQMYFSGFWSQGDGACFTGSMTDWKKFYVAVPEFSEAFPNYAIYLRDEEGDYSIEHRGHYYHENCTTHDYSDSLEWCMNQEYGDDISVLDPEEIIRYGIYTRALTEGDVGNWLKNYFKGLMRQLYRDLEKEYEYQTSDDAVWETIQANELDKELSND